MLIDSHCHLDFSDFAGDLDGIVARARAFGVGGMLTICTKLTEFDRVLSIAERYDNIWCSVGIHPHEAAREPDTDVARLLAMAHHPKVVGIGETGLDYYYDEAPRDRQKAVFKTHIEAAYRCNLPLIVHSRDADKDTVELLHEGYANSSGKLRGVIHCFTSTRYLANQSLEMGFYISLSGIVTFKNATALRDIAKEIPEDRLLVETDAPYLAPVPMRGKRNEPSFVRHTLDHVAKLRDCDGHALATATSRNFLTLFDKVPAAKLAASS